MGRHRWWSYATGGLYILWEGDGAAIQAIRHCKTDIWVVHRTTTRATYRIFYNNSWKIYKSWFLIFVSNMFFFPPDPVLLSLQFFQQKHKSIKHILYVCTYIFYVGWIHSVRRLAGDMDDDAMGKNAGLIVSAPYCWGWQLLSDSCTSSWSLLIALLLLLVAVVDMLSPCRWSGRGGDGGSRRKKKESKQKQQK